MATSRALLQHFVRATAPWLGGLWRALYGLARRVAVERLASTRGVVAVYQVGGADEPIRPGQSDIDLLVVVEGDPTVGPRVVELLRYLHVLMPMIESPERSGVFERRGLRQAFIHDPLLQVRALRKPRLLHGADVLADLRPTAPAALRAVAELGAWWRILLDHARDPVVDGYLVHKLAAGGWRAVCLARGAPADGPRAALLADPGLTDVLPAALAEAARAARPLPRAEVFGLLHQLVAAVVAEGAPSFLPGSEAASTPDAPPPGRPPLPDPADLAARGLRVISATWDRRPDNPERDGAPTLRVEADDVGALLAAAAAWPAWRLELVRDGLRYPVPADPGPLALPSTHPERWGLSVDPTRAAQIAAAKERWLSEARASVRDGSIAGLRDGELDRLAAGVVSATGAAVSAAPSSRDAPAHQALVLALADALGAALPAAFAAAPDAWFSSTARVSVLICTRNRRELLRTALDALTRQTRAPDEVVVVNNGSADGTEAVLDAFSARLPLRAVWLEQPGIPGARNAALAAATGDILCFTDDDAIADPGWLAAIEDRFLRDPRVGLVGGETLPDPAQPGLIAAFFRVYMGSEVSG